MWAGLLDRVAPRPDENGSSAEGPVGVPSAPRTGSYDEVDIGQADRSDVVAELGKKLTEATQALDRERCNVEQARAATASVRKQMTQLGAANRELVASLDASVGEGAGAMVGEEKRVLAERLADSDALVHALQQEVDRLNGEGGAGSSNDNDAGPPLKLKPKPAAPGGWADDDDMFDDLDDDAQAAAAPSDTNTDAGSANANGQALAALRLELEAKHAAEVAARDAECDELHAQAAARGIELEKRTSEVEALAADNAHLAQAKLFQAHQLRADTAKRDAELEQVRQALAAREAELEQARAAAPAADMSDTLGALGAELSTAQADLARLEQSSAAEAHDLRAEAELARQALASSAPGDMSDTLGALGAELSTAQVDLARLEQSSAAEAHDLRAEAEQAHQALAARDAEIAGLTKAADNTMSALGADLEHARQALAARDSELAALMTSADGWRRFAETHQHLANGSDAEAAGKLERLEDRLATQALALAAAQDEAVRHAACVADRDAALAAARAELAAPAASAMALADRADRASELAEAQDDNARLVAALAAREAELAAAFDAKADVREAVLSRAGHDAQLAAERAAHDEELAAARAALAAAPVLQAAAQAAFAASLAARDAELEQLQADLRARTEEAERAAAGRHAEVRAARASATEAAFHELRSLKAETTMRLSDYKAEQTSMAEVRGRVAQMKRQLHATSSGLLAMRGAATNLAMRLLASVANRCARGVLRRAWRRWLADGGLLRGGAGGGGGGGGGGASPAASSSMTSPGAFLSPLPMRTLGGGGGEAAPFANGDDDPWLSLEASIEQLNLEIFAVSNLAEALPFGPDGS